MYWADYITTTAALLLHSLASSRYWLVYNRKHSFPMPLLFIASTFRSCLAWKGLAGRRWWNLPSDDDLGWVLPCSPIITVLLLPQATTEYIIYLYAILGRKEGIDPRAQCLFFLLFQSSFPPLEMFPRFLSSSLLQHPSPRNLRTPHQTSPTYNRQHVYWTSLIWLFWIVF